MATGDIELDLFSRMTTRDYLCACYKGGFAIDELILEVSSPALSFRTTLPERYEWLRETTKDRCEADDLILKSNLIRAIRINEG